MADPIVVRLNVKYFRWLKDDTGMVDKNLLRMEINLLGITIVIHCLMV